MDLGLRDTVALVTGAARGIGRRIALTLADEAVDVAVNDLDRDGVERVADEVRARGRRALALVTDITDPAAVDQMVADAVRELDRVDVLVNNAGVVTERLFAESERKEWEREIDVGLYGTLHVTRAVVPHMLRRKSGRIVSIASDSARSGQARISVYAAAKAAIVAFSKSLAQEVGPEGITVNVVCPGSTNTDMRKAREAAVLAKVGPEKYAERQRKVLQAYPLRRVGEPEDIANMVVFLVSSRAAWVTGQVISVNGGYTMM
jgi:NAD(P)-dependent dehydrogenase (short-subunit alcohol dehydrogenase family)